MLDENSRSFVLRHLLGRLAKETSESLFASTKGIISYLDNSGLGIYVDFLVRLIVGQPTIRSRAEHEITRIIDSDRKCRAHVLHRLSDWVNHFKQQQNPVSVSKIEEFLTYGRGIQVTEAFESFGEAMLAQLEKKQKKH
jgi:hypothetical protein